MRLGGIDIGVRWLPWWAYDSIPLRIWVYAEEHGSDSFFWRVFGLEFNVPKDQP